MSKEKIIEYVMNSPYNTNRQVLEGLLDGMGGEEYTVLLEETVTTTQPEGASMSVGNLAFTELIDADNIRVTFDDVVYECTIHEVQSLDGGSHWYGGLDDEEEIDFSEYPFILQSLIDSQEQVHNLLLTESSGTHSIKIEVPKDSGASQSDWSTAEVTFINTGTNYDVMCAKITSDSLQDSLYTVPTGEELLITIPLYKNKYLLNYNERIHFIDGRPIVTGNIQFVNGVLEITGNGTISCKGIGKSR